MTSRNDWGKIRRLRSGNYQASYIWPRGSTSRVLAPVTFQTKTDARGWLAAERTKRGQGIEPVAPAPRRSAAPTFADYAARIIANRISGGLSLHTATTYRGLLNGHLLPTFGAVPVDRITVAMVNDWYASYGGRLWPTRAGAYRLLAGLMKSAIDEGLRETQPCRIRGGAQEPPRAVDAEPATYEQVDAMAAKMRPEWGLLVLLGAYCTMRFGELAELRRGDIVLDGDRAVIRIRRAVSRVDGEMIVGPPKSAAGRRDVAVPSAIVPDLVEHLAEHVAAGRRALIFTTPGGEQLYDGRITRDWTAAREAAGLPAFHFHDLRHTGATWLAREGATLRERMHRLGHSDFRMAARYEHADAERDAAMADRISARRSSAA